MSQKHESSLPSKFKAIHIVAGVLSLTLAGAIIFYAFQQFTAIPSSPSSGETSQSTPSNNTKPESSTAQDIASNNKKPKITTTVYPIFEFTKAVSGDLAEVTNIVPSGIEPHDFEPNTQQITDLYKQDLLILNGGGIDTWVEKIRPELEAKNIRVLDLSAKLKDQVDPVFLQNDQIIDPHLWLDPVLAQKQVEAIQLAISELDPLDSSLYEANSTAYQAKLGNLDQQYRKLLSGCKQKTVISPHQAFDYLARRYQFETLSLKSSDGAEISAKEQVDIIREIRDKDIEFVGFDGIDSQKLSKSIADDAQIKLIPLRSIETLTTEELEAGQTYIELAGDNLTSLRSMLACS